MRCQGKGGRRTNGEGRRRHGEEGHRGKEWGSAPRITVTPVEGKSQKRYEEKGPEDSAHKNNHHKEKHTRRRPGGKRDNERDVAAHKAPRGVQDATTSLQLNQGQSVPTDETGEDTKA